MDGMTHKFIGTKLVLAVAMVLGDYNKYRGWEPPEGEDQTAEGYLVEYTDGGKPNHEDHKGYISWSPKAVFEAAYKPADTPKQRAVIELTELDDKLAKLGAFIDTNKAFTALAQEQQHLLVEQRAAMQRYHDTLDLRLARWEN